MQEFLDRGAWPTQKEITVALRIREATVSEWNKQPRFHQATTLMRRAQQPALDAALIRSATIRGIKTGNAKIIEACFRRMGLWNAGGEDGAPATSASGAAAVASVTFVNLPQPPTKASAAAHLPPQGAAWGVMPDGTRVGG